MSSTSCCLHFLFMVQPSEASTRRSTERTCDRRCLSCPCMAGAVHSKGILKHHVAIFCLAKIVPVSLKTLQNLRFLASYKCLPSHGRCGSGTLALRHASHRLKPGAYKCLAASACISHDLSLSVAPCVALFLYVTSRLF